MDYLFGHDLLRRAASGVRRYHEESNKQFFRMSIEKMFENYFILIPRTTKYKLKDKISKEQAKYAGFLIAFMLINAIPITKDIHNICIVPRQTARGSYLHLGL